jgi:predicted Zn-dependent protease
MSKRPPLPSSAARPSALDQALDRAVLALQMQRPFEAERIAGEVLKANRGNLRAAQLLGHALLMQNRAAEAVAPLEKAARRSDDPTTRTLYAAALAQSGFSEEALKQIRQLTVRRPLFPPAYLEHAGQLTRAGRFEEAIAVLDDGLAQMPGSIDLQRELAALHLKRNARTRAREILLQALAAAPERPDLLTGLAHVLLLDGEYAEAADLFRRVLALRPDDAVARADYGRCLLELGERDAGEASIVAATRESPPLFGRAVMSLAVSSRGRFFLRPSAVEKFLRGGNN